MVPDWEDLTYEERLKEMLTNKTKRKKRKRKLNYNIQINEQTTWGKDRKYLIIKWKGEARYLRGH